MQVDLQITHALSQAGLVVTCQAVNADGEPTSFGVGFHPYLTLGTASVDGLTLTVPANTCLEPASPAGGPSWPGNGDAAGLHPSRRIGSTRLDTAFGSLVRGDDGRAVAQLRDTESARSVHLWVDDAYGYLMVYTADGVARPERRRAAVAVEPMTCPPDAFRTAVDLIELEPGESWQGSGVCETTRPEWQYRGLQSSTRPPAFAWISA